MIDSLTGKLLVASSLVTDPMYAGGVCLVVHHDEENLIGVMLNRPLKPTPEAMKTMLGDSGTEGEPDESTGTNRLPAEDSLEPPDFVGGSPWRLLHFGGPLSGPVVAVHPISQYGDVETGHGIFVAAQKDHLEHLVREQEGPCRLIVGHLGWETEQLQSEIDEGIWHIVPATVETVFSPAQEMWSQIIRRATSCSLARWIGTNDNPHAASVN
ncbi:MAG: YqgE/AlgH family protein [Planctomycetota bacterium]